MTTPLTDERVVQLAKEHNLSSSSRGIRAHWDLMNFVKAVQQPSVAPPAPGGDVLERRSETGMPMSANAPEKCPITRRPFFMVISHPELGWVPTYGGPYDSYTIPHMEGKPDEPYHERELTCHHYDHDYGGWVDDESIPMRVINEGVLNALQSTQAPTAAAQGQDAAPAEQPQTVELLDERGEIRRDLKSSAYCVGNEYKPFHPSASHVRPEWRDGWNACFVAAIAQESKAP